MDIRTLITEAMRRQGLNPGAAAGAYATGPGVVNTPYATTPPVTAARGVEQDVQPQNPQDILRKLTGFRPTSDPQVALRDWQEFINTQRAPSMWAQIAPGTPTLGRLQLAAQEQQAREAQRHDRAQLAETIRANKAREALTGAAASASAGQPTTSETRPRTMDALKAEATAAGALALGARFRHNIQAARGAGEQEDPMFTATDAIRRGLSDPNFRFELDRNQVDLYDLLNSFTVTNMGVPLPAFVQKLSERQPRKKNVYWNDYIGATEIDPVAADPLYNLLQGVVGARALDNPEIQLLPLTSTPASRPFSVMDLFRDTAP